MGERAGESAEEWATRVARDTVKGWERPMPERVTEQQHIPGVLPPISGTKDEWHILLIEGSKDDPEVTWMHPPSCGVTVSTVPDRFDGRTVRYECHTQHDIDNAGMDGIFDRLSTPSPLPRGMWAVHPWVEKISGFDYTEYDGGWTVIPLAMVPDA